MKVVVLAGGFGTRIAEESHLRPKPMIEIGGRPILWHILKAYSHYGFQEFIICAGYKSEVIKDFFANYHLYTSDITFDFYNNSMKVHNSISEPWKVTIVDTGLKTETGGRIKKIEKYIDDENFLLTYGDGVSDVNIRDLFAFHVSHGKIGTLTAIQPRNRFGAIRMDDNNIVESFKEKPVEDNSFISGGFFVFKREIFNYIQNGDSTVFEKDPLENLSNDGQLMAYKHRGFWQAMDTLREKNYLEELWNTDQASWRVWD